MIFMLKDDRGLMEKCPQCGAKISPGYDLCLSCGYKFGSDIKAEEKARRMKRFTLNNSWLLILVGSFLGSFGLTQWFVENFFIYLIFVIIGVVVIIFGVVGIYFIKKNQMKPKVGVKSRELKDYFSSTSIISIISGLAGIIIYYIFVPGGISFSSPTLLVPDLESLYATPFLLAAIISGMLGVYKKAIPVIDLIGGLIGFIWFFMSNMPVILYLIALVVIAILGVPH